MAGYDAKAFGRSILNALDKAAAYVLLVVSATPAANTVILSDGTGKAAAGWIPDLSATYQIVSAILTAIIALSGTGMIVRTGSGTVAVRSLASGNGGMTATNADGVSGNPTLTLNESTFSVLGATRARVIPGASAWLIANQQYTNGATLVTLAVTLNRLYLLPLTVDYDHTLAKMGIEVTTLGAGNARLAVYKANGTGQIPSTRIWSCADQSVGATGGIEIAFSTGTFDDSSYSSGGNLICARGETLWFAVILSVVATLRATGTTVCRQMSSLAPTGGGGNTPQNTGYREDVGSAAPPATTTATVHAASIPALWVQRS